MRIAGLAVLLCLALVSAPAIVAEPPSSPAPPALLSKADLAADVDVLQHAYESLHPGLYRYNTPEQMRAHFATLRKALDHDQTLGEAYLALSQFAATVKCGHTYANFYNQPEAIRHALFERADRVPFEFRWLQRRMIVTRNLSNDASLRPGTEVVSIDGIGVGDILAKMTAIARADGGNDAKRVAQLELRGEDTYETFDVFLPLLFPAVDGTQTLVLRDPGESATRAITVAALTFAQRKAAMRTTTDDDAPAWTFAVDSDGIARLRMPGWALYDSKWDWKGFLQQAFVRLDRDRAKALVIDLRGNEGGLGVGDVLLAHLVARDTPLPALRKLVRYRKVPDDLAPVLDTWDPSFKDWGAAALPFDARYFRLTRWDDTPDGDVIRPVAPRYTGRVFVLVDATNSSATFEFAQQVKRLRVGTLVGQTTGGNQRGINGGAFFFLRLPHSKIELDLPLVGQFPLAPAPDAGIEPDIAVIPTIEDIAGGRDAELAAVRTAMR